MGDSCTLGDSMVTLQQASLSPGHLLQSVLAVHFSPSLIRCTVIEPPPPQILVFLISKLECQTQKLKYFSTFAISCTFLHLGARM